MIARIYFNLNKKMLSVQTKVDGKWKVTSHCHTAYVRNAQFKVSESGRQRVLNQKKKNVHAFIIGTLVSGIQSNKYFLSVRYNPYEMDQFQCQGANIFRAEEVLLHGRQVFAAR